MYCISISYKTAGVDVRKKLAFSEDDRRLFIKKSLENAAEQCVLLCTCNRTEVYFGGDRAAFKKMTELLAEMSGSTAEELALCMMTYLEDGAVNHLFRTAAGLDSMVVGEDEILRQLKSAYALSRECGAVRGDFNIVFQAAFACAKKIKTETALSKTSVSIATLAANEAARLGGSVGVLLIGATGKTGMTVLKNLSSHKNVSVAAAVRSRGECLASVKNTENIRAVDYSDRYDFIGGCDCVISATSSPHYTVTAQRLKSCAADGKPRLFIDLAVPPDIDPAVGEIAGARLIGIDYFEQLAKENNALKADSAENAAVIIAEQIDELKKELCFRKFLPIADSVKSGLDGASFEEFLYRLKSSLDSDQLAAVFGVLKSFGGSEI